MALKKKQIVIDSEGRDKGKMFIVNEMSARQAEKWALKVFFALSRSGFEVPADVAAQGLAGVAALGIPALGNLNFEDAEPLLDEMFEMISFVPDPAKPSIVRGYGGVGPLVDDDIEEVVTRLTLRKELLLLHLSFFTSAAQ